jgi:hypothetical protein
MRKAYSRIAWSRGIAFGLSIPAGVADSITATMLTRAQPEDLYLRIKRAGQMRNAPKALQTYRRHDNGHTPEQQTDMANRIDLTVIAGRLRGRGSIAMSRDKQDSGDIDVTFRKVQIRSRSTDPPDQPSVDDSKVILSA